MLPIERRPPVVIKLRDRPFVRLLPFLRRVREPAAVEVGEVDEAEEGEGDDADDACAAVDVRAEGVRVGGENQGTQAEVFAFGGLLAASLEAQAHLEQNLAFQEESLFNAFLINLE